VLRRFILDGVAQCASGIKGHQVQSVDFALCLVIALKRWSLEEVLRLERGDFLKHEDGLCEVRRPRLMDVSEDVSARRVNRLPITLTDGWTEIPAPMADSLFHQLGVEPGDGDVLAEDVLKSPIFDKEVQLATMWAAVCARADELMPGGAEVLSEFHSMEADLSTDDEYNDE
jgi:hypothetical protein